MFKLRLSKLFYIKVFFILPFILLGCENAGSKHILIEPKLHGGGTVQLNLTSEDVQKALAIVDGIVTSSGMMVHSRSSPEIIVYNYGHDGPRIYCHVDIINNKLVVQFIEWFTYWLSRPAKDLCNKVYQSFVNEFGRDRVVMKDGVLYHENKL